MKTIKPKIYNEGLFHLAGVSVEDSITAAKRHFLRHVDFFLLSTPQNNFNNYSLNLILLSVKGTMWGF